MNIAYIAKHYSGGNDDEGAIAHALEVLGHTVHRVQEEDWTKATELSGIDLCLFHKWADVAGGKTVSGMFRTVFWYFDRVMDTDPSVLSRSLNRREWMRRTTPLVRLGFCTDGDWVAEGGPTLRRLTQGADERTLTRPKAVPSDAPLLLPAVRAGKQRTEFVDWCEAELQPIRVVPRGVHGKQLSDLCTSSLAVVCPDSPGSDRYWSNRAYLCTGLGGLILHPAWATFDLTEPPMYRGREMISEAVDSIRSLSSQDRHAWAERCHDEVVAGHLYRHRVEQLLAEAMK